VAAQRDHKRIYLQCFEMITVPDDEVDVGDAATAGGDGDGFGRLEARAQVKPLQFAMRFRRHIGDALPLESLTDPKDSRESHRPHNNHTSFIVKAQLPGARRISPRSEASAPASYGRSRGELGLTGRRRPTHRS
jgi:hypothetical protein